MSQRIIQPARVDKESLYSLLMANSYRRKAWECGEVTIMKENCTKLVSVRVILYVVCVASAIGPRAVDSAS
jgi:hypothetical protein